MCKFISTVLLLLATVPSWATLHIQLTQGMNTAVPIAVVPFANQTNNVPGDVTMTDIIKNDLQNSGEFRIKMPSSGPHPSDVSQLDFQYWRKQGVNDVIVGSVRPQLGGYKISFQLISLYNKSLNAAKADPNSTVLLAKAFTAKAAGLRELSHYISNLIYQKLTGVRGIFTTKIAYVLVQRPANHPLRAKYFLQIADYDGFDPQKLLVSTQPIMSPIWSPNGRDIVYVSFENHAMGIYLQQLASGQRRLISELPGINGAPSFSPDGKKLALVLSRTGNPKIYVFNLETKKLTEITHGYSIDTEPSWSPDGKRLIFTSNRGGTPQIYQYTFATKQIQRLTFNGNYNARASFLPNGHSIVMMHRDSGLNGVFSIDILNLQNSQMHQIAELGYNAESPSAAPNGKMVIYATTVNNRGVLAAASTNGQVQYQMPTQSGSVQEPAWSPFVWPSSHRRN